MDLREAIAAVTSTGSRIQAALDAADLTACHELIELRQKQLEQLRGSVAAAAVAEREACRAAWAELCAADRELQASLAATRRAFEEELNRRRGSATGTNPYRRARPACCDRRA